MDRLRDLIAPMPSPFAVAATNKPALFEMHGSLIGQEVRMLGLNSTFAPVLDLRTMASEAVMTTRVVSGDPDQVTLYARHFLKGLARQGVLGCGKHFPGLGSGQVDSHHATPTIAKPFDQLWQEDLLPYRRLAKHSTDGDGFARGLFRVDRRARIHLQLLDQAKSCCSRSGTRA